MFVGADHKTGVPLGNRFFCAATSEAKMQIAHIEITTLTKRVRA